MPRKKPSPIARAREALAVSEARIAELASQVRELETALAASILIKTFQTLNEKHESKITNPMPINPKPAMPDLARSRLVQIKGQLHPVIINDYHEARHDGKITMWGSNQSRLTFRNDEIEFLEPLEQAPGSMQPARPSIPELPPAPSEEDEFVEREESKTYRGYDRDSF